MAPVEDGETLQSITADCTSAANEQGQYVVLVTEAGSAGANVVCRTSIPYDVTFTDD